MTLEESMKLLKKFPIFLFPIFLERPSSFLMKSELTTWGQFGMVVLGFSARSQLLV